MAECVDCPWRYWPVECHASQTGHKRLCELIRSLGRKDYADYIEAATLGTKLVPPKPPPATFASDAVAVRMELCDFRVSTCGCLTKPAACLLAGYPAVVTLADCQGCTV